jgi:hypothetical protein
MTASEESDTSQGLGTFAGGYEYISPHSANREPIPSQCVAVGPVRVKTVHARFRSRTVHLIHCDILTYVTYSLYRM